MYPHIIQFVMRFDILPSPTAGIVLHRYEKFLFPMFDELFETLSPSSRIFHIARALQEAAAAVVLENRADKAITAWRLQWQLTDSFGTQRPVTTSGDSYSVNVSRPIAEPSSRHLVTPSGCVSEALLEHIRSGGGLGALRMTRGGGAVGGRTILALTGAVIL